MGSFGNPLGEDMEKLDELIWKKNPNGKYWVSENGDIINAKTNKRLSSKASSSNGYVRVGKDVCRGCGVHNAVYEAFVGEIPHGMQINHIDGNKSNNHLTNLELCTPSENVIHAHATGLSRARRGEEVTTSKVTKECVLQMYQMFKLGYTNKVVGDIYGLCDRYVSLIRHGRRWTWLFEEVGMYRTKSLGNLTKPLPECVYIYNKCMTSRIPQDELADILDIDASQVSRIRTGKAWTDFREFYNLPEVTLDWRETGNSLTIE